MLRSMQSRGPSSLQNRDGADAESPAAVDLFGPQPGLAQVTAHLQAVTSLSLDQIDRVLAAARLSLRENFAKAKTAIDRGDLSTLANVAHSLKGILLQFGLDELAAKADTMDRAARNNSDLSYKVLVFALESSLVELLGGEDER